jgi:hypothetical protein
LKPPERRLTVVVMRERGFLENVGLHLFTDEVEAP